MTAQRLHDLLDELVADTPSADVVEAAWQRASRTRRRRRLAALGSTTAAVVAVVGAVAVLGGSGPEPAPQPGTNSPSPSGPSGPTPSPTKRATVDDRPDTTYRGAGVWWSPSLPEEAGLPWVEDATLPREIDLAATEPLQEIDHALAVFVFHDNIDAVPIPVTRVVVLAPDGSRLLLDHSRLEPVRDEADNHGPVSPQLSGDGRHVLFAQNSSVEVYTFATGTWRTVDTPDWQAEGARWLDAETIWVPHELGPTGSTYDVRGRELGDAVIDLRTPLSRGDERFGYGPVRIASGQLAQSYHLTGPVEPVPEGNVSNPAAVVVRRGERLFALALDDPLRQPVRSKGCCGVVGWLDTDTVVYGSQGRLLAWRVGSHDVRRVAEIVGRAGSEGYAASWALPFGAR
jgi:hypothetical protein